MNPTDPRGNPNPTIQDLIRTEIRAALLELNTCMPATIKSYDPSTRKATVQPSFRRTTIDGRVLSRAELIDIPVAFPYNGTKGITYPLEDGTPCLVLFSQRSLEEWEETRDEVTLLDGRLHDISDGICIPVLGSISDVLSLKEGLQLNHDKMWIGNAESPPLPLNGIEAELFTMLAKIIEILTTSPWVVSGASASPSPADVPKFEEIKAALEGFAP